MNAYELNKAIGAILGALVFVMGLSVLSDIIFSETPPAEPGYQIAIADAEDTVVEEAPAEQSFDVLLASADPEAGESGARVCSACHSFEADGPNGIGPHLWNIVGREMAVIDGFNYSSALVSHADEAPVWTYEELDGFLENPQGWVPGTIMGYAGIKDAQDRADVIAYLKEVSPDGPPLPEAPAPGEVPAAEAEAAEAETDVAEAPAEPTFATLLASADASAAESAARVCSACHVFDEGGANRVGPVLWNVVGREIAAVEDFNYSSAMREHAEEADVWDYAQLDGYLENPQGWVPGTSMSYAGIKDDQDRANMIAYLRDHSPDAPPLPEAPSAGEVAAAGDATSTDAAPEAREDADADADTGGTGSAETAPADDAAAAPATNETPTDDAPSDPAEEADAASAPTDDAADTSAAAGDGTEPATAEEVAADEVLDEAAVTVDPANAAGHDDASVSDPAVANVVEGAAEEIATSDEDLQPGQLMAEETPEPSESAPAQVDVTAGETMLPNTEVAAQAPSADSTVTVERGDDNEIASTVDADDAASDSLIVATPNIGASTEPAGDDVDAAPAAAALTVPSEAVVDEPMAPGQGGRVGQFNPNVETDITNEGVSDPDADTVERARRPLVGERGEDTGEPRGSVDVREEDGASLQDEVERNVAAVAPSETAERSQASRRGAAKPDVPTEATGRVETASSSGGQSSGDHIHIEPASQARIEIVNPSRAEN